MLKIKITLENIGPITKADLELGQITVIVGENNVGKSFVLKSVYSIFKAFEMERILLRYEIEKALRTCRDALSTYRELLQKVLKYADEKSKKQIKGDISNINYLLKDIEFYLKGDFSTLDLSNIAKLIKDATEVVKRVDGIIKASIERIAKLKEESMEKAQEKGVIKGKFVERLYEIALLYDYYSIMMDIVHHSKPDELEKLPEKIRSLESVENRLKMAWKILIDDVFGKDIVRRDFNTGKITVKDIVSFSFDGDVQMEIKRPLYPLTPIFVESPLLLEIKPYLAKTTERKIKSLELPIHIGSFFDYAETISKLEEDEILKELKEIIGGEVYYSVREDKFYFKSKQDKKPFDIQNVASGIKSFGILQLLLRSGASENMIFFWEEPESHLHPEWQIKFAEIVAKIVKRNNYFVISTHSPFMVEILRVVAKENDIDANFYYMGKNSELIEVNDENWDIISDSLLEPLREIAFRLFKVT